MMPPLENAVCSLGEEVSLPEGPEPEDPRGAGPVGIEGAGRRAGPSMPSAVSDRVCVQRAMTELRSGRPVLILGPTPVAVISAEAADTRGFAALERVAEASGSGERPSLALVLSPQRLSRLGLPNRTIPGVIELEGADEQMVCRLATDPDARFAGGTLPASMSERSAIELARLALLLPAVVRAIPSQNALPAAGILSVDAAAIDSYTRDDEAGLTLVSRASCPLDEATDAEIVVFRTEEGLREQVAVIIGQPDLAGVVKVRLHSACLTGDLFGSLRCDCGDQLRGSVRSMTAQGGGILLYLDHEGRGIGLANKIRAYRLQSEGLDTFEADEALGFSRDHRSFRFAAAMLRMLSVGSVCLFTNNAVKALALENAGVHVAEIRLILGRVTAHNAEYLAAKRDVARHDL